MPTTTKDSGAFSDEMWGNQNDSGEACSPWRCRGGVGAAVWRKNRGKGWWIYEEVGRERKTDWVERRGCSAKWWSDLIQFNWIEEKVWSRWRYKVMTDAVIITIINYKLLNSIYCFPDYVQPYHTKHICEEMGKYWRRRRLQMEFGEDVQSNHSFLCWLWM